MNKGLLTLVIFLSCALQALSQAKTGSLSGVITTTDEKPAANVSITLRNTSRGAITADDGTYLIKKIPAGEYIAEITLVGYAPVSRNVNISAGAESHLDIGLSLSASELNEVIIRSATNRYLVTDPSPSLRLQEPLLNVPQNIQVVTANVLSEQQIYDMSEAVTRNVSGATSLANESWGNYANLAMRGGAITAFRNGMNVKMPWGPLTEDMSMVERIEFVKGPAGFMLASGNPTGFYNIVTKKPTGINKGEATLSIGSFEAYRATLDLDGKLSDDGHLLYRFNMMGQMKNSQRQFDFNDRYSIAPVITYKFNDKTSLTAEYTFQHMKMAMLGSSYLFSYKMGELPRDFTMLEANLEPSLINDHSLFLNFSHQLNSDWKLTTQLAYLNYSQTGASVWADYPSGLKPNGDLTRSIANWDAASQGRLGQIFLNGKATTGKVSHTLLGGVDVTFKDYSADFYQAFPLGGHDIYGNPVTFNIYNPVHGLVPPDDLPKFDRSLPLVNRAGGKQGESSTSLYVQDMIGFFGDRLRVTVAGRHTKLKQHSYLVYSNDNKFTPRAGISYSIDKSTSVYGLFDKMFLAQQGADSAQKPFVPITGTSLEAGVKKLWSGGRWNSTLSVYRVTRNNIVTYIPGPEFKAVQTGQTRTSGVELDVKGAISRSFNVIANYAYTKAKVTKDEDKSLIGGPIPGPGFPKHIANAWLSYRVAEGKLTGFGAALGYQFITGRQYDMSDYARMDGSLFWQSGQLRITLNASNIFDKYLYAGAPYEFDTNSATTEYYYQVEPGINFRLGVGYHF